MTPEHALSDRDFAGFQRLAKSLAGIHLAPAKKALVCGRLAKRLRHLQLDDYGAYLAMLQSGAHQGELQVALDLLTTNETHFFREPRHFEFLRDTLLARKRGEAPGFRIWSAACSSGEEPYSIAMVLAHALGERPWDILASDISTRVLEQARLGCYPLSRAQSIPDASLRAYCLRGVGSQEGSFRVIPELQSRIAFRQINLSAPLPHLGQFDLIFLRNVMIYFDPVTKRQVVSRLLGALRPGGFLLVGHSETLNGIADGLRVLAPSIYQKP
jgi:chemotaxis protein methyltransferase CheR